MSATVINLRTGDKDAVAIGNLCSKARGSMVDSVKYLIEAGQKLVTKKESLEHGEWMPWLKENADVLGFSGKNTAAKLMKAATIKIPASGEFDEAEAAQINRGIWGHTKSRKRKPTMSKTPKPHYKADEIVMLADAGLTMAEIATKTDVGQRQVRHVIDAERTRRASEPKIDPETLAISAREKLAIALRQQKRKLDAEHAARTRGLDEEVRQRVLAEGKEYLAMVKEKEEKADKTVALYQEFINNRKPLFTVDQFNLMRKCLHQGGIAASPRDFDAAFNLIQTKKFQLTGQK